jgi:hypothetical protein
MVKSNITEDTPPPRSSTKIGYSPRASSVEVAGMTVFVGKRECGFVVTDGKWCSQAEKSPRRLCSDEGAKPQRRFCGVAGWACRSGGAARSLADRGVAS